MPPARDLLCLSHLRWDFVFQRPQHLLSRCARERRVLFVEEPFEDATEPRMDVRQSAEGVTVAVPHLPPGLAPEESTAAQRRLLDAFLADLDVERPVVWYYTPMALDVARHVPAAAVVYDCMDELSAFALASPLLREREDELFATADLVFTGGPSLYTAKRERHPAVHLFPSSVDRGHFGRARQDLPEPADVRDLARPRIGYYGVIDERLDLELVGAVADARPSWQLVLVGPVVKIDPDAVPVRPNVHALGLRPYADLPAYLASWDVAIMPFALNDSTRFISPTKTLEYLAAGRQVVSTPVRDVVQPYGERGLVHIAADTPSFVASVAHALNMDNEPWLHDVDAYLERTSWDRTWQRMAALIEEAVATRRAEEEVMSA